MEKIVSVMPGHGFQAYYKKLSYLEDSINTLYKNDRFLIPAFLLRCQLIEFSLKYLAENYPYKKHGIKDIDKFTLGQVIKHLENFDDDYLKDIIANSEVVKDIRNMLTHNLIKSVRSMTEIKKDIKSGMGLANKVEQSIWYYFEFLDSLR